MNYLVENKNNSSVIFITHFQEHLQNFADRILILNNGMIDFESKDYSEATSYYNTIKSKQIDE
jgi:ABC-type multidrug transport system ATPase subunit